MKTITVLASLFLALSAHARNDFECVLKVSDWEAHKFTLSHATQNKNLKSGAVILTQGKKASINIQEMESDEVVLLQFWIQKDKDQTYSSKLFRIESRSVETSITLSSGIKYSVNCKRPAYSELGD